MRPSSEMEFWQDYKREVDLAAQMKRPFRLSLREYAKLRMNEREVKEASRAWRQDALKNLFTTGSGVSLRERLSATFGVFEETLRRNLKAGQELRQALNYGINPAGLSPQPSGAATEGDFEREAYWADRLAKGYFGGGRQASRGLNSWVGTQQSAYARQCGARTTKDTWCMKPWPCPHHGR